MSFIIGMFTIISVSIAGGMLFTGVCFIIPVMAFINKNDNNPLNHLWCIPVWLLGMWLLIYVPILYFILAIPICMLGFIFAVKEWLIALAIGAIILGIAIIHSGGI